MSPGLPAPVQTATPALSRRGNPWSSSTFWVLQLVVLALSLVRLAATVAFHLDQSSLVVELSTFVVFCLPVTYVALTYGLAGGAITVVWVAVLDVPRVVFYAQNHLATAGWLEIVQLVLLAALAILIGWRVSAERTALQEVEAARHAHLQAEARYRDLFERNASPILIVDPDGFVVEANTSAQLAFAARAGTARRGVADRTRLVDMIGPDASAEVLSRLVGSATRVVTGADPRPGSGPAMGTEQPPTADPVAPVAFDVGGVPVLYRPTATLLAGREGDRSMQVVFEDVTAETRRRELIEAFAGRVVQGQEEERRHLAQELHDGPVQSLVHLCRQIDLLRSGGPEGGVQTADLRSVAEGAVAELRSIARGLRPSILDDLGLVASINQLVSEADGRHDFAATFGTTGPEQRLTPGIELALFRIAQEALTNVARHAHAEQVAVGLSFEPGGLRLLVTDDGIGIHPDRRTATVGRSLGLPGMEERAHFIGARLVVRSAPGSGTSIDVWVPATDLVHRTASDDGSDSADPLLRTDPQ